MAERDTTPDSTVSAALAAYAERAVAVLQQEQHALPAMHRRTHGWQPRGEGHFVFSSELVESLLPDDRGALHSSPEYRDCVAALRAHPVINERLDKLVGTNLGASTIDAAQIPDLLLHEVLADAETVEFDSAKCGRAATRLTAWLTRQEERYIVVAPLAGLAAEVTPVVLEPGIEIDRMTDDEVVDCLTVGLPIGHPPGRSYVAVHDRIALRMSDHLPLVVGDGGDGGDGEVAQAARARWRDAVEAVVFALRLLKSGPVSSPGIVTRPAHEYGVATRHFSPSPTPAAPVFDNYVLSKTDGQRLVTLWQQLRNPRVVRSKPLATAVRRFGFAGERSRAEDQIIDLMVGAEAIFLPGEDSESAHKLSLRAALLIAPAIQPSGSQGRNGTSRRS